MGFVREAEDFDAESREADELTGRQGLSSGLNSQELMEKKDMSDCHCNSTPLHSSQAHSDGIHFKVATRTRESNPMILDRGTLRCHVADQLVPTDPGMERWRGTRVCFVWPGFVVLAAKRQAPLFKAKPLAPCIVRSKGGSQLPCLANHRTKTSSDRLWGS
jgi:hypothetical protein